ncbi:MAG: TylF/MycF/NovP-related O-methyltransferase [Campylobacterota bacterium]|nr:TylF/MycF/NovP-related O-methyltransferase [Campylobacterota bacterium]
MENENLHNICNLNANDKELEAYKQLVKLRDYSPIPDSEVLANEGLFLTRSSIGRMLFLHDLYKKTINTHGSIMEFGVRWGQNMAYFTSFRSMYEPYNLSREVIGFDTFEGFPSVSKEDGTANVVEVGSYTVGDNYEKYLGKLLDTHEALAPRANKKKYKLIKGDVMDTLPEYLKKHPETIISLVYFDLDLYEPTKKSLELLKPHLAKNSIIAFDQLCLGDFPGETIALKEVFDLNSIEIHRSEFSPQQSYIIFK